MFPRLKSYTFHSHRRQLTQLFARYACSYVDATVDITEGLERKMAYDLKANKSLYLMRLSLQLYTSISKADEYTTDFYILT